MVRADAADVLSAPPPPPLAPPLPRDAGAARFPNLPINIRSNGFLCGEFSGNTSSPVLHILTQYHSPTSCRPQLGNSSSRNCAKCLALFVAHTFISEHVVGDGECRHRVRQNTSISLNSTQLIYRLLNKIRQNDKLRLLPPEWTSISQPQSKQNGMYITLSKQRHYYLKWGISELSISSILPAYLSKRV